MNLGVSLLQRRSMTFNYKILLLLALCICNAESADPLGQFCNTDTNMGSDSQISANIDRLLAELVSKTTSNMVKTNIKFWPDSM